MDKNKKNTNNKKNDKNHKKTNIHNRNNNLNANRKNNLNNENINHDINSRKHTQTNLNNNIDDKSHNNNIVKINSNFESKNFIYTKKIKITFFVTLLIFVLLIGRIGFLQFVQGNELKESAYKQQAINQIISPKRGNIYDSTGTPLAISSQVDTITINPTKIKGKNDEETKALKETVAKGLSDIFSLDYNETLEKVNSTSSVETIIKKIEQDKVEELKKWMEENKISEGINIDEDTKRSYPYNNVASQVIGFCGTENQGLSGIEATWNSVLTGTPGKIVSSKDGSQQEIPNTEEKYISAENGSDLTLTIDLHIQTIVEKYLKQAVEDIECEKGGNVIVMNPKNGDILAMATYPDYNLNEPYTPNSTLAKTYDSLSSEEKTEALYRMWSNKSVADTYEPGSTFKVITSAIALEENITTTDKENDFYCGGYEEFQDASRTEPLRISCWSPTPHRSQSLRDALCNSCNPAFMQLGARITAPILYKYYDAFGFFESTNSGLYGEQSSIFYKLENVHEVELATMSFGQRFNITPLQLATAIACIANDGVLMQPRIVKQITNTDTGAVTEIPVKEVRQVISKETADQVKSMMESVATVGSGKNAAVTGYSVGGKTGTSEPIYTNLDAGYVASYVAISPVEDTQVVLLLTLYDPPKEKNSGGVVAAPVVSQMLTEILPHLGIPSNIDATTNANSENLITVPEVRNKTVAEAEKNLKAAGFIVKTYVDGDANSILVQDQNPKPGASLPKGSIIILYGENNTISTSVTVPDLKNMNYSQAFNALKAKNLNISVEGSGTVISQDYSKDSTVPEGTIIKVILKESSSNLR